MGKRVFISYKCQTLLDEPLALRLGQALAAAGHYVFDDQSLLLVGENWVKRIREELQAADFLILLLSANAIESAIVVEEVRIATAQFKETGRQPRILPVRVAFEGALPYDLGAMLNHLHYAQWHGPQEDGALLSALRQAIEAENHLPDFGPGKGAALPGDIPFSAANPLAALEAPEGTMMPDSPYYIRRGADDLVQDEQQHPGYTLSIQASRQMGKSSLLSRAMQRDRDGGKAVAFVDFQAFGRAEMQDADRLCHQFAFLLDDALGLDSDLDKFWQVPISPFQKCTRFMERRILPACPKGLLLALDEADSLLDAPTRSDFFGMLRSWHNERATKPQLWRHFSLAMVISTDPSMLIENVSQSPFNVGVNVRLRDFTLAETHAVNLAHGWPLSDVQVRQLYELLAGHPYLTRKALYLIVKKRYSPITLLHEATEQTGPFGDHLRAILSRLSQRPELLQGIRDVLNDTQLSAHALLRLEKGGIIAKNSGRIKFRNSLYELYFRDLLL